MSLPGKGGYRKTPRAGWRSLLIQGGEVEKLPAFRGVSREEYLVAVRLCPKHPAFSAGYEAWTRTTLREIERICTRRQIATSKRR